MSHRKHEQFSTSLPIPLIVDYYVTLYTHRRPLLYIIHSNESFFPAMDSFHWANSQDGGRTPFPPPSSSPLSSHHLDDAPFNAPPRPRKPIETVIIDAGFALPADHAATASAPATSTLPLFDTTSPAYHRRSELILQGMEQRLRTLITRHHVFTRRYDILTHHRCEVERRLDFLTPHFNLVEPPMLAAPAAVADPEAVRGLRRELKDFTRATKRAHATLDGLEDRIWHQARRVQVAAEEMARLDVERGYALMHELWARGGSMRRTTCGGSWI